MSNTIQGGIPPSMPDQTGLQRAQTGKVQAPAQNEAQMQLNVSIVQTSLEVSISAKDQPMQFLFKNVITNLNEVMAPTLGPDAIQNAMSQDNSPEATADRIFKLSTGLLEAFRGQHPGEDPNKVSNNFMDLIRKGIDQGFKEARDILQGLGVLQGDIASNIDKTYELVQQKLDDFQAKLTGSTTQSQA